MLAISVIQEEEMKNFMVQGQPGQKASETLSQPISRV
jgi:hypothetical protein